MNDVTFLWFKIIGSKKYFEQTIKVTNKYGRKELLGTWNFSEIFFLGVGLERREQSGGWLFPVSRCALKYKQLPP